MKRIIKSIAAMCVAALALTGCKGNTPAEDSSAYTWNVAMNVSESTLNYKMMEKFKELIEERSNGQVQVNLYANGLLGNDTEQMQGLIEGSYDFSTTITSGLTSFVPAYGVFDCPNAFPDLDTLRAVLDDEKFVELLNQYSETANIKLMGMTDAGFRETTSNVPVTTADGFKGIKIRVIQNPYHIAYWQDLGANALAMDFSEVYVGLQQKTIDAQENPYMNIVANKFYETQDYVIETNHLAHVIVFLMNNQLYESLPEDMQELVDQCAYEAVLYTRGLADESIASDKKIIVDSGTEIIELPVEEREKMKDMASDVYDKIRADIGDELVDTMLGSIEANKAE
ncbi:MAG: TRAP transporter substrate-binding protein [Lachnoclostridium edouardi]|uniref:TRAP transporter substrate-binding protein n=1 Tax=Lachnoclostridium edouardi TaxID=1926283 RepID=UPI0026DC8EB1|nr:TRAP transporter substrate-binding protein [Lachnoclostridium edouardi]MDO4277854.1 TRAP transporter substrate-binding protein [Lachnoclostridium edouardi]